MKKLLIIFVFCCASLLNIAEASLIVSDTAHWYMKHSYDVLSYSLNLDLYGCYAAPYPHTFTAKEIITLKVDSALNSIKLNAVNTSIQIDSVRQAGVSFTHLNDTLQIQLDRTYQPGETVSVRISYHHKNVTDNAFYVSNGYVFTDCPPEGARKWFPCWDRPSDKALTDITVKVPLNVRLGSNGMLSDSVVSADTLRYHWVNGDPISTYLITITSKAGFAVSRNYWHHLNNPSDSIPIRLFHNTTENIANAMLLIPEVTNFYSTKFGEYPFEKIGFASLNSSFPWGGMENQSMINLMSGGYNDNSLMAHENSHMWFGDMITCGTWADIWLNEGFGTYCDKLYTEFKSGYMAYKYAMNGLANYYLTHNPGLPLYNPSWAIHTPSSGLLYSTALIYDKGACVLFQLRYVLGDSLFFETMRSYALDTTFRYKNAVTLDFIGKVNQVSGQDYQWFFDEWVYAPNHPEYSNTYNIRDLGAGAWRVDLELKQVQSNTVFFRMPVEVQISFEDATDTIIKVNNDTNPQEYSFTFTKQPLALVFDPDRNILLKQSTTIVGLNEAGKIDGFTLSQNEPNPFNGLTRVKYSLPSDSHVNLVIIDSSGRQVRSLLNRDQLAGVYAIDLTADDLVPGIYYLRMQAGALTETRKMVMVR